MGHPLEKFAVSAGNEDGVHDIARIESGTECFASVGKAAEHPRGVVYRGAYEDLNDGVCVAVRRHAKALEATGVPVFLQSFSFTMKSGNSSVMAQYGQLDEEVREELGNITSATIETPQVSIQHVTPYTSVVQNIVYPRLMMSMEPQGVRRIRSCTILMVALERDRVSTELAEMLSMVAEVWTPCSSSRQALINSGVNSPVVVMPHPHREDDPFLHTPRRPLNGRPLRILNVGKWEPRKDHHALIGGFLMAIKPEDSVELILKTRDWGTWRNYPKSSGDSIAEWLQHDLVKLKGWTAEAATKKVKLMPQLLSRPDLARLYSECDLYVSSGHGEGFDLPAYDAKLMQMPMVYCPGQGPRDFSVESDTAIETHQAPCFPLYGWEEDACWDGYSAENMATALEVAVGKIQRGDPTNFFDRKPFTFEEVGKRMLERCKGVVERLGGTWMEGFKANDT